MKIRLIEAKGLWVEELYDILWAYRTTPRAPTGETPFKLIFKIETVIPVEIDLPTIRTKNFQAESNSNQLRIDLDLLNEI